MSGNSALTWSYWIVLKEHFLLYFYYMTVMVVFDL